MRRPTTALFVILAVLVVVPGWTGEARLDLLGDRPRMKVRSVPLDPADPKRRRVGALTFLGGWQLTSGDPAFGGYSALDVVRVAGGNRVTMLSDGGNVVQFTLTHDGAPEHVAFRNLPGGPGTGWEKRDRDTESMAIDHRTGTVWTGYERYNAVVRYTRGFAATAGGVQPRAMRRWEQNGGPEAMARMPDGRFVVMSETNHVPRLLWRGSEKTRLATRDGLIFSGDPLRSGMPARFGYVAHGTFDVSDATALPDGRLLVLERDFRLPFRWLNQLVLVEAKDVAPGRVARGRVIARIAAPLVHDNFEGIATTREGGRTIVWLVSDDNQLFLERTLLLKFRLEL